MIKFNYTINDEAGLHARPAGILVKRMQQFTCDVKVTRGEKTVDAKKMFALMGLGVRSGETITISAEGIDEQDAITAVQEVLTKNL
ncbi:HPr family phosphocarrier protein [Hydrogenoanaerobacterium sp.]|uniref:HPr family phosphocarrier protein n=1 Tax=Hydrogenoanaerobacterium sp. TaxID=2953763 RepID=UPI00289C1444|nr:HPr family phosphocarrier protein [Hydrogenoanaerobacterium sp.]